MLLLLEAPVSAHWQGLQLCHCIQTSLNLLTSRAPCESQRHQPLFIGWLWSQGAAFACCEGSCSASIRGGGERNALLGLVISILLRLEFVA